MPLDWIWDLIQTVVSRSELRAAVALIPEVAPPGVNPEAEWQAALGARLLVARKFVRILAETIEFGATTDATKTLIALQGLPALLEAKPSKQVPTGFFDARQVDVEVVAASGRAQGFTDGRPPGTVDRVGYTFCVLSQFHTRLRRRDIFAAASSRWADGFPILDADVARLSPYRHAHINVHGHDTFTPPDLAGGRRKLRDPDDSDDNQWTIPNDESQSHHAV